MRFNKIAVTALLATTLTNALYAKDVAAVAEAKYSLANAKATSYTNTASDITHAQHLSVGLHLNAYDTRVMLNYKPIRWKDAKADLVSVGFDYIHKIDTEIELYMGAGFGTMSYEAKEIRDKKTVYTLQAGINYTITESLYAIAGINYLNTNGLGIHQSRFIYSNVESMFSGEIGVGVRF